MRKTSQDGGDTTSATSGVENEIKKPKAGALLEFKTKKIGKRTAPNLSEESDDAVVEPLLQKTTDKTIQSAKYFAKAKADTVKEISKLFNDKKSQYASTSGFGTTETLLSEKDQAASKPSPSGIAPLHNHMNTNVFHSHDSSKANGTTKSQVLVEVDGSKHSGYNPSPLIFTTAKIHIDGKSKHMEPVQMTPAPILSTVELSVSKDGSSTTNEKKVSNGSTVMNVAHSQPHVDEKSKENKINISNSNVTPVTQSKDYGITDTKPNLTKPFPIKVSSPSEKHSNIIEKPKENTVNLLKSEKTSLAQTKDLQNLSIKTTNQTKPLTTCANSSMQSSSLPGTSSSESIPADSKSTSDIKKDDKETKKLVDEPRILMSESKLKSTISENTKTIASIKATKPPTEPTKASESSIKQPQITQSSKSDKLKTENNKSSFDQDTKIKSVDTKDAQPKQNKNIKASVSSKSNTISTKSQMHKNTSALKSEIKTDHFSSKKSESSNDPSTKTSSSSTKTPTQSKVIDSKLSKELDKSSKSSANDITKPNSKISLNNTATSSANKMATSASIVKSIPNVTSSNVISSSTTDSSNKTKNNTIPSNSKAVTPTAASTTVFSSATKSQTTKTATSIVNTKPISTTSTKSVSKPVSSIKSPQIITTSSATKQPGTNTAKTSGKPPPFTKTPPVNTSSPGATAPVAKQTVSQVAQVGTSNTTAHTSASQTSSIETSNKTKALESNKKGGGPGDPAKDTKVSKA